MCEARQPAPGLRPKPLNCPPAHSWRAHAPPRHTASTAGGRRRRTLHLAPLRVLLLPTLLLLLPPCLLLLAPQHLRIHLLPLPAAAQWCHHRLLCQGTLHASGVQAQPPQAGAASRHRLLEGSSADREGGLSCTAAPQAAGSDPALQAAAGGPPQKRAELCRSQALDRLPAGGRLRARHGQRKYKGFDSTAYAAHVISGRLQLMQPDR